MRIASHPHGSLKGRPRGPVLINNILICFIHDSFNSPRPAAREAAARCPEGACWVCALLGAERGLLGAGLLLLLLLPPPPPGRPGRGPRAQSLPPATPRGALGSPEPVDEGGAVGAPQAAPVAAPRRRRRGRGRQQFQVQLHLLGLRHGRTAGGGAFTGGRGLPSCPVASPRGGPGRGGGRSPAGPEETHGARGGGGGCGRGRSRAVLRSSACVRARRCQRRARAALVDPPARAHRQDRAARCSRSAPARRGPAPSHCACAVKKRLEKARGAKPRQAGVYIER